MQPTLGLEVRNRRQLLERLRDNDRQGLGGIPMSEIREAVHNSDKAMAVSGGNSFWFGFILRTVPRNISVQ